MARGVCCGLRSTGCGRGAAVWVAANDDEPGVAGPGGGRLSGGRSYAVAGNLALAEDTGAVEAVLLCPLRFQGQWQDGETGSSITGSGIMTPSLDNIYHQIL